MSNVSELSAFSFKLRFNPDIVQVIDADPGQEGVQITLGESFSSKGHFVAVNKVDNASGLVDFAVTLIGAGPLNGNITLAEINWAPQQAGSSALTFEDMILARGNGTGIHTVIQHGQAEVSGGCSSGVFGQALLQGRIAHSGVTVSDNQGNQAQTDADGNFAINSNNSIVVKYPGYLSAQADIQTQLGLAGVGDTANLGAITLLAGDVNGDDIINIFDLVYMSNRYQTDDATADLNADGAVNVIDLVLAANNYQQQGPLSNWQ